MVKIYIGLITEVLEDYTIKFNIPGYAELAGEGVASPAIKLTRFPDVNEEVMLIQPNDKIEIFTYLLMTQDEDGISLQYLDKGWIRIDKEGAIFIENSSKGSIKLDKEGKVNINGHLEISKPS